MCAKKRESTRKIKYVITSPDEVISCYSLSEVLDIIKVLFATSTKSIQIVKL